MKVKPRDMNVKPHGMKVKPRGLNINPRGQKTCDLKPSGLPLKTHGTKPRSVLNLMLLYIVGCRGASQLGGSLLGIYPRVLG